MVSCPFSKYSGGIEKWGKFFFELAPLAFLAREKRYNKICRLIGYPVSFAASTFGRRPWTLMTGECMAFFCQYILGIAA